MNRIRKGGRIRTVAVRAGGESVVVYRISPPGPRRAAALVPPLIGGSGLQQYRYFKHLNRAGYEVISFDYRGHKRSGGRFSVAGSIEDTCAVTASLEEEFRHEDLFGIGDCYGAIPLLRAASERRGAFSGIALFNPMPGLRYMAGPRDLLRNYFLASGRVRARNPFDWKGILLATAERLFPGVDKSRNHFGVLDYARVLRLRAVWEYLTGRPLARLAVRGVPALVVYGRSDRTLRLDRPQDEARYRAGLERVLPEARFRALANVDHYWTRSHRLANELAADFFASLNPRRSRPASAGRRALDLRPVWERV